MYILMLVLEEEREMLGCQWSSCASVKAKRHGNLDLINVQCNRTRERERRMEPKLLELLSYVALPYQSARTTFRCFN